MISNTNQNDATFHVAKVLQILRQSPYMLSRATISVPRLTRK